MATGSGGRGQSRPIAWFREAVFARHQVLPFPAPAARLSLYFAFATALYFLGIYADIGIRLGESSTVPMVSALPGLAMLLVYPGIVTPRIVRFVVVPATFVLVLSAVAPNFGALVVNRLLGAGQAGLSCMMGYVAAWVLARLGRVRLHRFLTFAIPVFLILLLIEIVVPQMHTLMLAYHNLYGYEVDIDALDERESGMGGYRPKLFTSETSYVGTSAMLMLVGYVWTGIGVRRYVIASVYLVLATLLIRSPIVILALPPIFVAVYTDGTLGRLRSLYAFWMTIITTIMVTIIGLVATSILYNRLSDAASGLDYSTTYRTYGALAVAINVLKKYPLFGVGAGSLQPVKNIIIATYLGLGVPLEATESQWNMSINNAFASTPVYFGLVGTGVLLVGLWRLVRSDVRAPRLPFLLAMLGYFTTFGAIYTPKFVITLMVLFTVAKLRAQTASIPARSGRGRPLRRIGAR